MDEDYRPGRFLLTGSANVLTWPRVADSLAGRIEMIVGIEVQAAATVKSNDFAGLRTLAEACKDRFAFGAALYDSADFVPLGDKLAAAPLSSLWC